MNSAVRAHRREPSRGSDVPAGLSVQTSSAVPIALAVPASTSVSIVTGLIVRSVARSPRVRSGRSRITAPRPPSPRANSVTLASPGGRGRGPGVSAGLTVQTRSVVPTALAVPASTNGRTVTGLNVLSVARSAGVRSKESINPDLKHPNRSGHTGQVEHQSGPGRDRVRPGRTISDQTAPGRTSSGRTGQGRTSRDRADQGRLHTSPSRPRRLRNSHHSARWCRP